MDFIRHGSGVPWFLQRAAPSQFLSQGPSVPWAHRRPGYPLSGCVPAEPDSVSPGQKRLPKEGHRFKCPGTPEPCLENPRRSGGLVPRNLSRWPRRLGMASPANVTPWKTRGLCTIKASDHPQILQTSLKLIGGMSCKSKRSAKSPIFSGRSAQASSRPWRARIKPLLPLSPAVNTRHGLKRLERNSS